MSILIREKKVGDRRRKNRKLSYTGWGNILSSSPISNFRNSFTRRGKMAEFFGESRMWPEETFQLKSCLFFYFFPFFFVIVRVFVFLFIFFYPFFEENPEMKVNRSEPTECTIAWRLKFIHLLKKNCSGWILSGLFLLHFRLGSVNAKNMKWRFRRWSIIDPTVFPFCPSSLFIS